MHKASIVSTVNAQNAAQMHNNLGTIYYKDKDFFAAIKEYRIAIAINPDSQTTAVYFNNLGKVYLLLGEIQKRNGLPLQGWDDFSIMAQISFEEAISKDCMKLEYYENLIKALELTGQIENKKQYYLSNRNKNPFNVIPAALILSKEGDIQYANMLLDDFVTENPDIIISNDLKKIIKRNVKEQKENI
ncbi:MAG: tetratricopeptide repeat protein [Candidatus Gastranaerophilales bacterium]|nr:tetratricopeptide repeat protein [Candidatus Gastranaerophilales bacterium]